jgi:NADPH-dependent ferric siderophore reductase
MRRISLSGEDLHDFPHDQESGYVKLVLEHEGELVRRTYTVRTYNPVTETLDVDFVLHGDEGPASAWASNALVGDRIPVGGPGPKKLVDFSADWFLIAGDMTALPALSVNIEQLAADARGYVAIEILSEEDKQELPFPPGMEVHWVINPEPNTEEFPLLEKIRQFKFLEGRPSMWIAGEFHTSRAIRRYLKMECNVQRDEIYASSYWHIGLSEDRHKVAKSQDRD